MSYLDKVLQTILVQVENEIMHEAESVADDNERKLIWQLRLFEEVLDLLRVVVVALPADPLDLADLSCPSSSLNILELDFRIGRHVDNRTEIVVETFESLERLKHLDEADWTDKFRVFGGCLDYDLEVLPYVDSEHLLEALERVLDGQLAKVIDEPLNQESACLSTKKPSLDLHPG